MEGDIIPGLPDDVSIRCLAMISHGFHGVLQTVCNKWRDVLRSHHYGDVKSSLGCSGDWIFALPESEPESPPPHWIAYDPASDTWHPLPSLPIPPSNLSHRDFSCVSVDGRFLIIGGSYSVPFCPNSHPIFTDSVFQFDPCRNQWALLASMLSPRANFACAVVAGKVIVAGGWNSSSRRGLASAEIYDPIGDRWEELPAMPRSLRYCVGFPSGGKLHVFSEEEHPSVPITTTVFDPANRSWSTEARSLPFPLPLIFGIVAMQDEKQYAISTRGLSVIKTRAETDEKWVHVGCTPLVAVPGHRQPLEPFNFSFVALRENLYVFGGNAIKYQRRNASQSEVITLNSLRACDPNVRPLQWKELKPMCGDAAGVFVGCGSLAQGQT